MIFFDTETCGLFGFVVLIQWSEDRGPINLHNVWYRPIRETLELIEKFVTHPGGICGFNLAFDWFMICKAYNTLSQFTDLDACPIDHIDEIAELEMPARDGPCLKPMQALDLMLHARQGPYQSTMDRSDIRIKRVPTALAWQLADELEKRIKLKDVYFARRKDKTAEKWKVYDIVDDEGKMNKDLKDIVLKFAPSNALKALAQDALGENDEDILRFSDVEVDRKWWPEECGWAPWAKALGGGPGNWKGAWPEVIRWHAEHWEYNKLARKYAEKDVEYTYRLDEFFGKPTPNDDNSVLACMVAAVRWKGFKVDVEAIKVLRAKAVESSKKAPTAPGYVKKWIWPLLSSEERLSTGGTTNKKMLEKIAKWTTDCPKCGGENHEECPECKEGIIPHPAAIRAKAVIAARGATKERELYDKLIQAGRLHASLKVIGALSGRMSGADGLNPQGIKKTKDVRVCFPLAPDGYQLCGGDFESFEVMIAIANYGDEQLMKDVTTRFPCPVCEGTGKAMNKKKKVIEDCDECGGKGDTTKKLHGLFAEALFPEEDYESILLTKGEEEDLYTKGKQGVFSQMYGGNEATLMDRFSISKETALEATDRWMRRYPGIKKAQQKITNAFQSMRQPDGFGKRVYWHDPQEYVESMLGFRRYFTLENSIAKALFDLAEKPPKAWEGIKIKVTRRDREQWATGAVRSALFGAAFGIQGCNVRAATNHVIQSTGAQITKNLQRRLWELQPCGVHEFNLIPLNIHDEVHAPCKPEIAPAITAVVNECVEFYKPIVPLLSMAWGEKLNSWADK